MCSLRTAITARVTMSNRTCIGEPVPARPGFRRQTSSSGRTLEPVKRCHGPTSYASSFRGVAPVVTQVHAAPRSPSTCRNQPTTRFQLTKFWLTRSRVNTVSNLQAVNVQTQTQYRTQPPTPGGRIQPATPRLRTGRRSRHRGSPQTREDEDRRGNDCEPHAHEAEGHQTFLPRLTVAARRCDRRHRGRAEDRCQ